MIRIGLAGYYGHGNFGDELFYEAFKRYFPLPEYRLEVLSKSDPRMRKGLVGKIFESIESVAGFFSKP